jgi:hypothetical protein
VQDCLLRHGGARFLSAGQIFGIQARHD